MLQLIARNCRQLTLPILVSWLLCANALLCVMTMTAAHMAHKQLATSLTAVSSFNSAIAHTDSVVTHHHLSTSSVRSPDHALHVDRAVSVLAAMTEMDHLDNSAPGNGCCDEADAVVSAGIASLDLPVSAIVLIVLLLLFMSSKDLLYFRRWLTPYTSSPPIPILNCAFLK